MVFFRKERLRKKFAKKNKKIKKKIILTEKEQIIEHEMSKMNTMIDRLDLYKGCFTGDDVHERALRLTRHGFVSCSEESPGGKLQRTRYFEDKLLVLECFKRVQCWILSPEFLAIYFVDEAKNEVNFKIFHLELKRSDQGRFKLERQIELRFSFSFPRSRVKNMLVLEKTRTLVVFSFQECEIFRIELGAQVTLSKILSVKNLDLNHTLFYLIPAHDSIKVFYETTKFLKRFEFHKSKMGGMIDVNFESHSKMLWDNFTSCHAQISDSLVAIGTVIGEFRLINFDSLHPFIETRFDDFGTLQKNSYIHSLRYLPASRVVLAGTTKGWVISYKIDVENETFTKRCVFDLDAKHGHFIAHLKVFRMSSDIVAIDEYGSQVLFSVNAEGLITKKREIRVAHDLVDFVVDHPNADFLILKKSNHNNAALYLYY